MFLYGKGEENSNYTKAVARRGRGEEGAWRARAEAKCFAAPALQRTRRGTEVELSPQFCLGCVGLLLVGIGVPCFRTLLSPVVSSYLAVLLALINMTSPKPCRVLKDVVFMNVRVLRTTSASLASFY